MLKNTRKFCLILLSLFIVQCASAPPPLPSGKTEYVINVKQGPTNMGDIVIRLYEKYAPKHCANFDSLVSIGFYNGTAFHRVVPGFMIQGGDPRSKKPYTEDNQWGFGEEGQTTVPAEFSDLSHIRGMVSAARKGDDINSATSQFFIVTDDSDFLDGNYSVFGFVVKGMEVVDRIKNAELDKTDTERPVEKIEMTISKRN